MTQLSAFRLSLLTLTMMGLAGCGPLVELPGSGPAPDHYTLTPLNGLVDKKIGPVLVIDEPSVTGDLSGTDLTVRSADGQRITYISDARWAERTPVVMHRHLLISFDNRSTLETVGGSLIELPADYRLKLETRAFHSTEDAPGATIILAAKLLRNGPVELIASRRFEANETAVSDAAADLAQAFDTAMDALAAEMIAWVAAQDLTS